MHCLIVDDHQLVAQAVGGLLSEVCNFNQLSLCCTVAEAVRMIQQAAPDLLVLDVVLPGEHWRDASDALQRCNPDGRVIFLTGAAEGFAPPQEVGAITLAVVEKSRSWDELVAVVQRWSLSLSPITASLRQQQASPLALSRLSPRELRVFEALGRGMLNTEIARMLGLTPCTVETYRKSICALLGMSGAELVRAAVLHRCCNPANAITDRPAA